jgi:hypothetical protein
MTSTKKVEKLVIIDLKELHVKQTPKCDSIVAEIVRGDKNIRSDEISCSQEFPCKVNSRLIMNTQFFVA